MSLAPRVSALAAAIAVLGAGMPVAAGEMTTDRQAELLYRLRHDCGSCHGMTMKGGLGPPLLPASLAGKDASSLAEVIRHGVPGTPMPPWAFEVSEDEARWLVDRLKEGLADAP